MGNLPSDRISLHFKINPLMANVPYMAGSANFLFQFKKGLPKKFPMGVATIRR